MQDRNSAKHSENMSDLHNEELFQDSKPSPKSASREVHVTRAPHDLPAMPRVYAIIDSVTDQIVGGLQIHMNDAGAIRQLLDIARGDTMLNKHPLDYDLFRLGELSKDHQIFANKEKIITGEQIEAAIKGPDQDVSRHNDFPKGR